MESERGPQIPVMREFSKKVKIVWKNTQWIHGVGDPPQFLGRAGTGVVIVLRGSCPRIKNCGMISRKASMTTSTLANWTESMTRVPCGVLAVQRAREG